MLLETETATKPEVWTLLITSIAALLASIAQAIASHFKGKRGNRESTATLTAIKNDLRDLRAHVIGPDGENGIRGDVRELKRDVRGLLERERQRAERS